MKPTLQNHATFFYVSQANRDRTEQWQGLDSWTPAEWACAAAGEMGEACNVVKKIFRLQKGAPSKREETVDFYTRQLEKEIGDTFIYLDLLAQRCGLDMYTCIATAFNQVSEREGYPHRLL